MVNVDICTAQTRIPLHHGIMKVQGVHGCESLAENPDCECEDAVGGVLQYYFACFAGVAFAGAVGAFEASTLGQLLERLFGDDVAAGHHHGGVRVGGLFFADRADKDGVEVVLAG